MQSPVLTAEFNPINRVSIRKQIGHVVTMAASTTSPEWPIDLLDINQLEQTGWQPTPFREFILKLHSRCNLACDYCYIYESADQSWRARPTVMSSETVQQAAVRIGEHAKAHRLTRVDVVLHGGEPLLAGIGHIAFTAAT